MSYKLQVVVTPRRWKPGAPIVVNRSAAERIWIERLEARLLFAAGEYNFSFGDDGMVSGVRVADDLLEAHRVLPQGDGSLLVDIGPLWSDQVASRYVARIDAKGHLDRSFGSDGLLSLSNAIPSADAWKSVSEGAFEVDHAGRFLLPTATTSDRVAGEGTLSLKRLNADGSMDSTFGRSGKVAVPLPVHRNSTATVRGMFEDSAGRIIVAVSIRERPLSHRSFFYVFAFRPDGAIDSSWGNSGVVNLAPTNEGGFFGTLVCDRFGHLVISGYTSSPDGTTHAAIARLLPNGHFDSRFGDDGWFTTNLGMGSAQFGQPSIDSQGRVLSYFARAEHGIDAQLEIGAMRVTFDGTVDQTFSTPGDPVGLRDASDKTSEHFPLVFTQPDDKPILNYGNGWLQRVNTDGSPDESFGNDSWAWSWHSYIAGDGNPAAFVDDQIFVAGFSYEDATIDGKDVFLCSWGVELMDAGDVVPATSASIPVFEPPRIVVARHSSVTNSKLPAMGTDARISFAMGVVDEKFTDDLLAPSDESILI